MRIKDIMNPNPFVLHEENSILHASAFMKEKKIRNLPVVDKDNFLVGLLTYREIIDALASKNEKFLVKECMEKNVKAVEPDTPLKGAIEVMLVNKFGCLPVIDSDRKVIGLVTETDMLKALHDLTSMPMGFYETT